ncbi:unnamed protein product, partial [Mycena citricolor]
RTWSFGGSGVRTPNSPCISSCSTQNASSLLFSSAWFCRTEMLTMDPVVAPGGRSTEGNSIRWARSPRRICTQFPHGGREVVFVHRGRRVGRCVQP